MTRPGDQGEHGGADTGGANGGGARHAAPEGAGVHPLIDLTRDPTPGVADHAAPDGEQESATE